MAKGYKFKLEAVLKMRRLNEDKVKMEIGRLNVKINQYKDMISEHESAIADAYQSQESELPAGLNGQELRFHPYFVEGKRTHIRMIQAEINMLQDELDKKYEDLKKRRGEVKVLENMKEKDHKAYKKHLNKKIQENLEEDVLNWNFRKGANS